MRPDLADLGLPLPGNRDLADLGNRVLPQRGGRLRQGLAVAVVVVVVVVVVLLVGHFLLVVPLGSLDGPNGHRGASSAVRYHEKQPATATSWASRAYGARACECTP